MRGNNIELTNEFTRSCRSRDGYAVNVVHLGQRIRSAIILPQNDVETDVVVAGVGIPFELNFGLGCRPDDLGRE